VLFQFAALPNETENAMIMRIAPSETEKNTQAFSSATIGRASQCFRMDGTLILEHIINSALIHEARDVFIQRYSRYLDGRKHDDALQVGARRSLITVDVEAPFDRPELFANSWLFSLLNTIFKDDFVLGAFGVVSSLPGAPSQHVHADGGYLFPEQWGLNYMLPTAAVTVAIPLLEMNELHGTTALWLGSHRDETLGPKLNHHETRASVEFGEEPLVREGSCVIWDYRLRHSGTPNRSSRPRPLLYSMYCRPWFVDHTNYRMQVPLRVRKRFLIDLPEELRRLLVRAQEC
jgi:hypothetical protein